jgi:hypothetical protein
MRVVSQHGPMPVCFGSQIPELRQVCFCELHPQLLGQPLEEQEQEELLRENFIN